MDGKLIFMKYWSEKLGHCRFLEWFGIFLLVLIDQGSKYFFKTVTNGDSVAVCDFIDVVSVWNTGVSFGLGGGFLYSNMVFIVISMLIIVVLFALTYAPQFIKLRFYIYLIISGAIGNLADRLIFGAVYDFIDVHAATFHWPAFNLADAMVFIGSFMFFLFSYESKNRASL